MHLAERLLRNQGFPGLITVSCRHITGENIAVFRQEFLNSPKHENDFLYTYHPNDSKIIISELHSNDEIMRISVIDPKTV